MAMDLMSFFRAKKPATAQLARDRLMVAVAWQRDNDGRRNAGPSYLPQLREELLAVVRKYVQVADGAVQVNVQREDGLEVLEMNIALPDAKTGA
jgi:cell division topological specificity factor